MVSDGSISAGHARALLAVEDEELMLSTARRIKSDDLTVRDVEKFAKKASEEKKLTVPEHNRKSFFDEVELALNEHLSRRVKVKNNKDGTSGVLEIEFYSEDDLSELARHFEWQEIKRETVGNNSKIFNLLYV